MYKRIKSYLKPSTNLMFDSIKEFINPSQNADLVLAPEMAKTKLPTLWLLGKTGAGKSSLIKAITHESEVDIGNGFAPCTMTSQAFDYPIDKPLFRFLDTRGLGEIEYDPTEDISVCSEQGHAIVIVAKVDEPEQSAVIETLKQIKKQKLVKQVMVVHTACKQISHETASRAIAYNQRQFQQAWGKKLSCVAVDFENSDGGTYNINTLEKVLAEFLPIIGCIFEDEHNSSEEKNFQTLKSEILWYCTIASGSDLFPAIGVVSVPAVQAKLLHSLANQYGVEWGMRSYGEFLGTLGVSFGTSYTISLGVRQATKFIPVIGQTGAAVGSSAISFATTYALGRIACKYFYHRSRGETVSKQELNKLYKKAFSDGKRVGDKK